ncbi:MAG: tetratricopeptide repeat protein [Sphingomonas sp.]|uniref:hypothetical protein n=1 Tax=Sphingomonas sp. TaxID=28214 RepID=UPI0025D14DCE|nr:hypothetical protein [Sphingomonas sp.]MBY0285462.1 tetratricopeptide repeat protein [Sphingomonas sp.]
MQPAFAIFLEAIEIVRDFFTVFFDFLRDDRQARFCGAISCPMIFAILFASPANAEGRDLCSSFSNPLSTQEIASLREDLLDVMPIQNYEVASKIKIRNVAATLEVFAPTALPDGHGGFEVQVPNGFRQLQCHLIYVYFNVITDHLNESAMKLITRSCLESSKNNPVACAYAVPKFIFEKVESRGDDKGSKGDIELKSLIDKFTRSAFLFIMLHEYAHIILGHLENVRLGVELEADTFAAAYGEFAEDSQSRQTMGQFGPFGNFAVMRFADGLMPADILHPPFACRARTLATVLEKVENLIVLIRNWPIETPAEFEKTLKDYTPIKDLLYPELLADIERSNCPVDNTKALNNFINDLGQIRNEVSDINKKENSATPPDSLEFVHQLMKLRLQSTMGRFLRGRIISVRLRDLNNFVGDRLTKESYSRSVRSFLLGPDSRFLSAGDFGRLTALEAFHHDFTDQGRDIRAVAQAQITKLKTAIRYNPKFALAYFYLALAKLQIGQCDDALAAMDQTNARAGPTMAENARRLLRDVHQKILTGIAAQGCERFTANFWSGDVTLP